MIAMSGPTTIAVICANNVIHALTFVGVRAAVNSLLRLFVVVLGARLLELALRLPDGSRELRDLRRAEQQQDDADDEDELEAAGNHHVLTRCRSTYPMPATAKTIIAMMPCWNV